MKYLKEYNTYSKLELDSGCYQYWYVNQCPDLFDELSDYLQELFDMFRIKEITSAKYDYTDIRWIKTGDSITIYTNNEEEDEKIFFELSKRQRNIEKRLGHQLKITSLTKLGIYGIRIQILKISTIKSIDRYIYNT